MMMSEDGTYCIRFTKLKPSVHGLTMFDESGFANIYINSIASYAEQRTAIQHELRHVLGDDGYRDLGIEQIEAEAERGRPAKRDAERLSPKKMMLIWEGVKALDVFLSEPGGCEQG